MIILRIFLHGKPNWYLPIEGTARVNPLIIRLYADHLKEHLYNAAEIVRKLQEKEWYLLKTYGTMYYLEYCKFNTSLEEINKELKDIGISSQAVIEEVDLENV